MPLRAASPLSAALLLATATAAAFLSAVPNLRLPAFAAVVLANGLLVWLVLRGVREAARRQRNADELQQLKRELEAQVETGAAHLHDATARLQSIIDSAVDGIVVIDETGRIESFNPGAERLFGYSRSEVLGRNVSMLMPSPYHKEHDEYLHRYLATGDPKIIGIGREVAGRRRDGSVFPLHLSVGEIAGPGGRRFTGILHNLTNRVALEERLRASKARWRAIVHSAVDGIVVIDAPGHIEASNQAAERLFGYREEEVLGKNVNILMPSPYHEDHETYLARYLMTGQARIIGMGREVSGLRRDGTTFPLHLSVGELTVGGERKFTGILHDLTNRVRMEEQLRERAALARVGEMAAVIAHEVKNPLAGVRGAIQVIAARLPAESKDATIAGEILTRIDGLNDLIQDLLLFARPPQPRRAPVDLPLLVRMTIDLVSQDPALTGVRIDVAGATPEIFADAEMLKIVFQNLLLNSARDEGRRANPRGHPRRGRNVSRRLR